MDLSWEICWSHMVLGYLPPAHFARKLPDMCKHRTPKNLRILEACRRTIAVLERWNSRGTHHLDHLEKGLRNA
jgi:hypothetical protein